MYERAQATYGHTQLVKSYKPTDAFVKCAILSEPSA